MVLEAGVGKKKQNLILFQGQVNGHYVKGVKKVCSLIKNMFLLF